MLTVSEYRILYEEALESGDKELLESLTSEYFTEPLDRIYISRDCYIDHPVIQSTYTYKLQDIKTHEILDHRPGWFLPEGNIDGNS